MRGWAAQFQSLSMKEKVRLLVQISLSDELLFLLEWKLPPYMCNFLTNEYLVASRGLFVQSWSHLNCWTRHAELWVFLWTWSRLSAAFFLSSEPIVGTAPLAQQNTTWDQAACTPLLGMQMSKTIQPIAEDHSEWQTDLRLIPQKDSYRLKFKKIKKIRLYNYVYNWQWCSKFYTPE